MLRSSVDDGLMIANSGGGGKEGWRGSSLREESDVDCLGIDCTGCEDWMGWRGKAWEGGRGAEKNSMEFLDIFMREG